MKKQKTEIAVNESSGAEKVEKIEKKTPQKSVKIKQKQTLSTAKGEAALGSKKEKTVKTPKTETSKEMKTLVTDGKAERESRMAKARVERALRKKEAAEKRKQARIDRAKKRAEAREKRIAEMRAKIEKRKAEKQALAEKRAAEKKEKAAKRAAEKEAKLRARAHAKATRNQNRAKKNAEKKKSTENRRTKERKDGEKRNKGYGGWIAAVVTLGVVTLALATTVTVGGIEMRNMQDAMLTGYKGTMYELTGIMENVDEDLDRARVSASPAQQSRILTDLLVQARLAELDLEKMPVAAETDRNVTVFINRIAKECEMLLSKLRHGAKLSAKDFEELETLYRSNHEIRAQLDGVLEKMTDKDLCSLMKEGKGMLADTIADIENKTLLENNAAFDKKMQKTDGAGTKQTQPERPMGDSSAIDPVKAETLCGEYFSGYSIKEFQCVGETVNPFYSAYNVQGYDEKGTLLFAEISQKDGALLRFDFYEDCNSETFDMKNAERIAEDFLEKLGYDDMEAVRLRENGTMTDFTYVYEDDGVVYYPDEIRVKVCRSRGVVTAFDATKYLKNHRDRVALNVKISLEEAQEKLHDKLSVEASRLAVVKSAQGERAAYEFFCSYGEENYFVYLDAASGEELSILNAKNI